MSGGDDRADPEDVSEGGARRRNRVADASSGLLDLRFDSGDVGGQLGEQVGAQLGDRVCRCQGGEELGGVGRVELLGDSSW